MRVLALLALLFAATNAGATATTSGLHGLVVRGPITPMCVAEQPCTAPAKNVTLVFSKSGRVIARSKTDGAGRYRLRLPPGRYRVGLPNAPQIGRGLEPNHALVVAGRNARRDFSIDTGIR